MVLTSYRYFFSPDIERSLSPAGSLMSLATCCITYLCQDHHDEDIDEELFEKNVKNGVYRLHHFAADMWARLVESYFMSALVESNSGEIARLAALLDILAGRRANESYLPPEERFSGSAPALEVLQAVGSDAYELVRNELEFRRAARTRVFELGKGEIRSMLALPRLTFFQTPAGEVYFASTWLLRILIANL